MAKNVTKPNTRITRLAHNFLMEKADGNYAVGDIGLLREFTEYSKTAKLVPKKKVLLMFICTNPQYWQYIRDAITTARQYFLPDHDVDFLLFTDWSKEAGEAEMQRTAQSVIGAIPEGQPKPAQVQVADLRSLPKDIEVVPIDAMVWPYPTLFRYHAMLRERKRLEKYDALYYSDIDMRYVSYVGDEVLGEGLTLARHPMYALKRNFIPPYEPNKESASFIPRPGRVVTEPDGKKRYDPIYLAGGFQGGETKAFIKLMEACKKKIDIDLDQRNYIPIWNDESVVNSVMFEHQDWMEKAIILSPSYIYPDSLIDTYYTKLWGRNYTPRIVTLTKPFTIKKLTEEEKKQIHG